MKNQMSIPFEEFRINYAPGLFSSKGAMFAVFEHQKLIKSDISMLQIGQKYTRLGNKNRAFFQWNDPDQFHFFKTALTRLKEVMNYGIFEI